MKDDEKHFLKVMQARCNLPGIVRESPRKILSGERPPLRGKRADFVLDKWAGKGWYSYGVSNDLGWMELAGMAVRFERGKLVTSMLEPTRENFDRVADAWARATRHVSTYDQAKMRDGYALLVSMGRGAVPHVLGRLRADRSIYWCFLLCDLTGEAPDYRPRTVGGVARFNVERFARAWLRWGAAKRLSEGMTR